MVPAQTRTAGTVSAEMKNMVASEASLSTEKLRANFLFFTVNFAVNHGVVTVPLLVASSELGVKVGSFGSALFYVATLFSSLFLGAPATDFLGLRGGVLFGMLNYIIYAGLFAIAVFSGRGSPNGSATAVQAAFFYIGSVFGGVAAGVLWTAQGAYFARSVDLMHAQEGGGDRANVTSTLASTFAVFYLACELASKLGWSLLTRLEVETWIIAGLFTVMGLVALLLQARALDLTSTAPRAGVLAKVKAASSLWADPVLWLVAGINLTFGFSAAFMGGYVNATYTKRELGDYAVTLLGSLTAACAGVFSHVLGWVSTRTGKGPVVLAGAACFFGIPFCFFVLGCCGGWGWWLTALYVLQGAGRAVYESTNKGIFSDLFEADASAAFANQMLQVTVASSICFFLQSSLSGLALARIAMVLSVLTPLGYCSAVAVRRVQKGLDRGHGDGLSKPLI